MSDITQRVEQMISEGLALTQHLASESRDAEGNLRCCVCGSPHALVCVGKGWGGVYACRSCESEGGQS
jgi:hypothetical protein